MKKAFALAKAFVLLLDDMEKSQCTCVNALKKKVAI
jgi:hypothetical protein